MSFISEDLDTLAITRNRTHKTFIAESLATLFNKVAVYSASKKAVIYGRRSLTYAELNQQSDLLASHLVKYRGQRIALLLGRNEQAIVTILAIIKAGAVYVPLDANCSDVLLRKILEDSAAALLLTSRQFAGRQVCCPELILEMLPPMKQATRPALPEPDPHQPACIIYTSGSAGAPKGVEVMQAGIRRLVCHNDPIPILPGDTVAQAASLAFDASSWEIWGALLNGATLAILPYQTVTDSRALSRSLHSLRVTHAWFTVALFNMLAADNPGAFGSLRHLLIGGDALNPISVAAVLGSETSPENMWNGYGPTENTTFTTLHYISPGDCERSSIPIGRPIVNTCCYVLDQGHQPVPVGEIGELYISGEGLARGYFNQPEKTAAAFIANPFYEHDAVRTQTPATPLMYKTGDLVRWLEDGTLEFIGRADDQIKIRGYSIVPGEVEHQLLQLPGVSQAVVMPTERNGERQLAAWCVAKVTVHEILADLHSRLPAHMVPSSINTVRQLPLTISGKVDKRRLPPPHYFLAASETQALLTQTQRYEKRLPHPHNAGYPLSEPQRRIWIVEQQQPGTMLHHLCAAFRLGGRIDMDALVQALHDIQRRHLILRIGIKSVRGTPRQIESEQIISPRVKVTASDAWLNAIIQREAERPFAFDGSLLWRVTLFRITGRHAAILFNFHHMIVDYASVDLFYRELDILYRMYTHQPHEPLNPVQDRHMNALRRQEKQDERAGKA